MGNKEQETYVLDMYVMPEGLLTLPPQKQKVNQGCFYAN